MTIDNEQSDSKGVVLERCLKFLSNDVGFSPARINHRAIKRVIGEMSAHERGYQHLAQAAVEAATVGETYFFRHRFHFDWLQEHWLPSWKERYAKGEVHILRVLSAGCSTGEEAYTLAAVLNRQMGDLPFQVVGCDINESFLRAAQQARYGSWSLRGVDLEQEADWLRCQDGVTRVEASLRERVRFIQHNILKPLDKKRHLHGPFDLIFCRNLLIYFHPAAVQQAYENLSAVLARQGSLLVGPSDPGPGDGCGLKARWESGVRSFVRLRQVSKQTPQHVASHQMPVPAEFNAPKSRHLIQSVGEETCQLMRRLSQLLDEVASYQFLREHLGEHPLDVKANVLAALYAQEVGHWEQGFEWGRRACFLAPDEPYILFILSDICRRTGRFGGAARYRRWAAQLLEGRHGGERLRFSEGLTVKQLREVLHVYKG